MKGSKINLTNLNGKLLREVNQNLHYAVSYL